MQLFGGISFGRETYYGKLINKGTPFLLFEVGRRYEQTTTDYVGIPVVLTFNRTFKKVIGAEINLFANFHTHTEVGFSVGVTLGKNYK